VGNVELVEVPTYFAVGSNVGAFTGRSYINVWTATSGYNTRLDELSGSGERTKLRVAK